MKRRDISTASTSTASAADIAALEADVAPPGQLIDDTRKVFTHQPKYSDVEPSDTEGVEVTEVTSETTILITAAREATQVSKLEVPEAGEAQVLTVSLATVEPKTEVKTGQETEDITIVEGEDITIIDETQQTEAVKHQPKLSQSQLQRPNKPKYRSKKTAIHGLAPAPAAWRCENRRELPSSYRYRAQHRKESQNNRKKRTLESSARRRNRRNHIRVYGRHSKHR